MPIVEAVDRGSLMTVRDSNECVGYLIMHEGKAYSPDGLVENVTQEQADIHNKLLSEALVKGLDENCQVGQGYHFYYNSNTRKVATWTGEVVSDDVQTTAMTITFKRKGKTFRGRIRKNEPCFNFTRVA